MERRAPGGSSRRLSAGRLPTVDFLLSVARFSRVLPDIQRPFRRTTICLGAADEDRLDEDRLLFAERRLGVRRSGVYTLAPRPLLMTLWHSSSLRSTQSASVFFSRPGAISSLLLAACVGSLRLERCNICPLLTTTGGVCQGWSAGVFVVSAAAPARNENSENTLDTRSQSW